MIESDKKIIRAWSAAVIGGAPAISEAAVIDVATRTGEDIEHVRDRMTILCALGYAPNDREVSRVA